MPRRPLDRQRSARFSAGRSFHLKKMGVSDAMENQSDTYAKTYPDIP
jgi:hypothetical protein